jgi:hypothetical protein
MGAALEPLGNLSEPLGGLSVNIHRAGGREKTGRKEGEKAGEIALSEYSPARLVLPAAGARGLRCV